MDATVELDIDPFVRENGKMVRRARNLAPVFRKLEPVMKADIDETFRLRTGPQEKWEKLAESTREKYQQRKTSKKRRAKRGAKHTKGRVGATSRLGRIRKAFEIDVGRSHLTATSKVPWAGVHQFGGRAGRAGSSDIPQRMFLYLSPQLIERALNKIAAYVARRIV